MKIILILWLALYSFVAFGECQNTIESELDLRNIVEKEVILREKGVNEIRLYPTANYNFGGVAKLCLGQVDIDEKSMSFRVKISDGYHSFLYQGKYDYDVYIPVLSRTMNRGDNIKASDIYMASYPASKMNPSIIANKDDLIDMSVKASLKPDRYITTRDIYKPVVVEKNQLVAAFYNSAKLDLKMSLVALENGSKNDVIKLKNPKSGSVIKGKVLGENVVLVN